MVHKRISDCGSQKSREEVVSERLEREVEEQSGRVVMLV